MYGTRTHKHSTIILYIVNKRFFNIMTLLLLLLSTATFKYVMRRPPDLMSVSGWN